MVEEYFIENQQTESTINFGYFVQKVFEKQVKDFGEVSALKTRDRVKNVFKNCASLVESPNKNKNVLLVGKVQSGKTSNLEMFTAFAFDNGYKCVIIYGGYDTKLLAQTSTRFRKTFDINEESVETDEPELFSTDDGESVNSLDEDVLRKIVELNKPIIFVSMKRPQALSKINNAIKKIKSHGLKTFIIDDEGDQASLNTEFRKNHKSPTYDQIITMKHNLDNPLYLSVTATPQANVLLGEYSELKPEKLFLIEPGDGYTGAEFFHLDDKHIIDVNKEDVVELNDGKIPNSIYNAVNYFLIASALMKKNGFSYTDMIIHTHRTNKEHAHVFSFVYNYIQSIKDNISDNDPELEFQLQTISKVFTNHYFQKNIIDNVSFESIKPQLIEVIKDTHPILQDSQGALTQGNIKYKNHKIYIGGDLLQRGLTFKYLIATYFTRWPKNSGNMDTTIQRARWFGYRSKYLDYCKIFTTKQIQIEYSALTESENDLWDQCYSIEKGELTINDIVIDADSSTLNPTRKNVAAFVAVKFNRKWNNQKTGFFDKAINQINNTFIDTFLSKLHLEPSTVGRINSDIPSCFYSYITEEQASLLIDKTSSIFDYDPFNRKDLRKLISQYPVVIQKMFELYGSSDKVRERTFNKETRRILALQQGPDKADEAFKKYKGDSHVIVDEEAMTIQIFRIRPRFEKHNPLEEYDQYMFSIHIPESRKGFVKDDRIQTKVK